VGLERAGSDASASASDGGAVRRGSVEVSAGETAAFKRAGGVSLASSRDGGAALWLPDRPPPGPSARSQSNKQMIAGAGTGAAGKGGGGGGGGGGGAATQPGAAASVAAAKDEWQEWQRQNENMKQEKGFSDLAFRIRFFKEQTGLDSAHSIYQHLLLYDQLVNEMKEGRVLSGFVEGPLQFPPTYKFDPYSRRYDTGKKARAPAWCDRVLYSSRPSSSRERERERHSLARSGGSSSGGSSGGVSPCAGGESSRRFMVPGLTILESVDAPSSPRAGDAAAASPSASASPPAAPCPCPEEAALTEGITLLKYSFVDGLFHSDHRPVYAEFDVDLIQFEEEHERCT
jgi:hypothetical protein